MIHGSRNDPPDMPQLSPQRRAAIKREQIDKGRYDMGSPFLAQLAKRAWLPAISAHIQNWATCQNCALGHSEHALCHHVFCRGYIPADVLFIGEAPGISEEVIGFPFCGTSGVLLDRVVRESQKHAYGTEYAFRECFTNVVCCRPATEDGEIAAPKASEITACHPRLMEFINIIQPYLIIAVGTPAEKTVEKIINKHSEELTHIPQWEAIRHPSFMLRQPDTELEVKRATIHLADTYQLYLPKFEDLERPPPR